MCKNWGLKAVTWVVVVGVWVLAGCATLDNEHSVQNLRIVSAPPGADVYYAEEFRGTTPLILQVPRGRYRHIEIESSSGKRRVVQLPRSYRISESLLANLIFSGAYPLAVSIDFLTQAGWNLEEPGLIHLPDHEGLVETFEQVIGVVPPPMAFQELTEEIGGLVEKRLKSEFAERRILKFSESIKAFEKFQWASNQVPSERVKVDLLSELGATHLALTTVKETEQEYDIHVKMVGAFDHKETEALRFSISKSKIKALGRSALELWLWESFTFLPNTVTVDFANSWTAMEVDRYPGAFTAQNQPSAGLIGQAAYYLGAIGLSTLRPPSRDFWPRFKFHFTTQLQGAMDDFGIGDYPGLERVKFERSRAYLGVGPQLDMLTRWGTVYGSVHGAVAVSRLIWKDQGERHEDWSFGPILGFEIGYYRFFTSRLVLKLFARTSAEDRLQFQKALESITDERTHVKRYERSYVGISLAAYWPEAQSTLKGLARGILETFEVGGN